MAVTAERWQTFRDGVVNYARSLGDEPNRVGLQIDAPPTLMALCFQLCLLDLVGELDQRRVADCVEYISACQVGDGTFVDPGVDRGAISGFDSDYVTWQTTAFALSALHSLGVAPRHDLRYLDPFAEPDYLARWLASLDWGRAWYESNKVMFVLNGLQFRRGQARDAGQAAELTVAIGRGLDVLDSLQDRRTGYWGTDRGSNLFIGMGGAFHVLIPYYFEKHAVNHGNLIVRSTLKLQARDGLFRVAGGGACDDLDAVDMLVKLGDGPTVSRAIARCRDTLLAVQQKDGGFAWYTPSPGIGGWMSDLASLAKVTLLADVGSGYRWLRTWAVRRVLYPQGRRFNYSGIREMPYHSRRSDLWSTWFRAVTILLCASHLQDDLPFGVRFKDFPGLTYHDPVGRRGVTS